MPRQLTLRQIDAFKAVIENGTVSNAALVLNISQPSMSKLIANLEADTGLKLFDRLKGRLAPTEHAMRLYDEVVRVFAGVRQVENTVDAIRREEQGRLAVGVMTSLAGSFIRRAAAGFLKTRPNVFCSIQSFGPQWTLDGLISRKLDVGLVSDRIDHPYISVEPLMEHSLVCIMPPDHPLAAKSHIEPQDLDLMPFVAFDPAFSHRLESMFEAYRIRVEVVLVASAAMTICEFVADGFGVSLVHPLMVSGFEDRLVVRRFEPAMPYSFQLCRSLDSRNAPFVEAFAHELRATAEQISQSMLKGP